MTAASTKTTSEGAYRESTAATTPEEGAAFAPGRVPR